MATRLAAVSFGLATVAATFLLGGPVYSGFDGERATHKTLLEVNGRRVFVPVMIPVLISIVPLILSRRAVRIIAAVVMGALVFISGFSISMFYLPAEIAMVLAASVEDRERLRASKA
jgi:hypothetical protein